MTNIEKVFKQVVEGQTNLDKICKETQLEWHAARRAVITLARRNLVTWDETFRKNEPFIKVELSDDAVENKITSVP